MQFQVTENDEAGTRKRSAFFKISNSLYLQEKRVL